MRTAALAALLLAPLALNACGRAEAPPAPAAESVVRDDVYAGVLGVVVSVPTDEPGTELRIHHEHIPAFKTKDGRVNVSADGVPGMKSMVMPFPVAEGLDVSSLNEGDKVRFDFVVHWGGSPAWEITAFEVLDPETAIDFANKATEPPADEPAAEHPTGTEHPTADDHSGHDLP